MELKGSYDVAGQRIVRNRPLNGQPGYEVVVPFKLDTGETVVIDRGWLPIGNNNPGRPGRRPGPAARDRDRRRPAQAGRARSSSAAPRTGSWPRSTSAAYSAQLGYPLLTGAYGQLASETPVGAEMPFPFPKPSTDEGTHLSYSLQWFAFGVLMFIGFGYAARQQARNAAIDAEDAEAQAAEGRASCTPAARRRGAVRFPGSARTRPRRKRKTPSWTPRGSDG